MTPDPELTQARRVLSRSLGRTAGAAFFPLWPSSSSLEQSTNSCVPFGPSVPPPRPRRQLNDRLAGRPRPGQTAPLVTLPVKPLSLSNDLPPGQKPFFCNSTPSGDHPAVKPGRRYSPLRKGEGGVPLRLQLPSAMGIANRHARRQGMPHLSCVGQSHSPVRTPSCRTPRGVCVALPAPSSAFVKTNPFVVLCRNCFSSKHPTPFGFVAPPFPQMPLGRVSYAAAMSSSFLTIGLWTIGDALEVCDFLVVSSVSRASGPGQTRWS